MSSPFLLRFSTTIVNQLIERGLLEVGPAGPDAVAAFVAHRLAVVHTGSLMSSLEAALVACDDVEEVWVDLEELKTLVTDMDKQAAGL